MLRRGVAGAWVVAGPLFACGPAVEHDAWSGAELGYLAALPPEARIGKYELRVADVEGGVDVAVDGARPVNSDMLAWSPDGDRIAFVGELAIPPGMSGEGDLDATGGLFAIGPAGEQLLGSLSEGWFGDTSCPALSWSPRGDRIAVVRGGYSWAFQCQMQGWLLRVADLDVTAASEGDVGSWASDVDPYPPVWSSDGGALLVGAEYLVCGDDGELVSFGRSVRECAEGGCSSTFGPESTGDAWPTAWSPKGEWIAVNVGTRYGPAGALRVELWSADGLTSREVGAQPCSLEGALWFPDGARLLTRRACDGRPKEYVIVDVATGAVERELGTLGPQPEIDFGPRLGTAITLSPDGMRIAYETADEPSRIVILDLEDGSETVIAEGRAPAWRP